MLKTYAIPSVIEANGFELSQVAGELIKGLRLFHEDNTAYILGDLAVSEGNAPHKTINSSPEDTDYQILIKASLLLASMENEGAMFVTTGFPYLTYQLFRNAAMEYLQKNHNIRYDASTFSNVNLAETSVNVVKAFIMPEIGGCDLTIRNGEPGDTGSFFIVSLGYGTFEAALSTPNGIIQRTTVSGPGLRYAINGAAKELLRTHYIGLKTEHQLDMGFRNGSIVLNRTRIDLTELRRKFLVLYYREVISPLLAKTFSDVDFNQAKTLYLVGGGALYQELPELFANEFQGLLDVKVVPEPTLCAAKGYCINSREKAEGANVNAVGIDIGNSNTVISVFKDSYSSF